jgi:hypothetical protein
VTFKVVVGSVILLSRRCDPGIVTWDASPVGDRGGMEVVRSTGFPVRTFAQWRH